MRDATTSRDNAATARTSGDTAAANQAQARYDESLGSIMQVGQENSTEPEAQRSVGAALGDLREWEKAVPFAERAVALAPEDNEARLLRAQARYETDDFAGAMEDAKRVLEANPSDGRARSIYSLAKKRVPKSGEIREAGPAEDPASPDGFSGWEMPDSLKAGQTTEAGAQAAKLLREAKAKSKLGDHAGALDLTRKALALDPRNPVAHVQAAVSRLQMGNTAAADASATQAIGLGFKHPIVYRVRALARNMSNRYLEATRDATAAIDLDPRDAHAYHIRARAHEALRRPKEETLSDYRRAAELDSSYAKELDAALARLSRGGEAQTERSAGAEKARYPVWLAGVGLALAALAVLVAAGAKRQTTRAADASLSGPAGTQSNAAGSSRFELGRLIGTGGMGSVYEGYDPALKRKVAIKRLRAELADSPKELARLVEEARTVAALHHPNIVEIHAIVQDGTTDLVFEYVPGETLSALLDGKPGRRLSPAECLPVLQGMCAALTHAHARGVMHLDLKPSNVMVEEGGWVKVMDFGISRRAKATLSGRGQTVLGTPLYMAPEQEDGKPCPGSDLFSLGACAFEMLTGGPPFPASGSWGKKREAEFEDPRGLVPSLPEGLSAFFKRALAPEPGGRPASAEAFLEEFRRAAGLG